MSAPERLPGASDLLHQSEAWILRDPDTGEGRLVPLAALTESHRANLMRWLERKAGSLHQAQEHRLLSMGSMLQGEQALDDLDAHLERMADEDPLEWLRDTPLYQALDRITGRRSPASFVPPPDPVQEETRPPEDAYDFDPSGYSGGIAELGYEGDG